jgi:hypothetical protein
MSFLVFFSTNGALLSVRVFLVVVVFTGTTKYEVVASLDHDLLSSIHAHDAKHFIRDLGRG